MKLHYLQHVPFEGLGSIATWAQKHHHTLSVTRLYLGESLPPIQTIDGLIVMGGPMNIDQEDQYPWLVQEKQFIEQAIQTNKMVLGICLGAQLIAQVLGAKVYPGRAKEIGWFPLQKVDTDSPIFAGIPSDLRVFHWHGDTFDIPAGASRLASSEACQNQAFIYGDRVLGLQFHLESTPASVQALIDQCADELVEGKYIQTPGEMLNDPQQFAVINGVMETILAALCQRIERF